MQIDFHLAGTYTFARCAGLPHGHALVVATAAQYVDDATQAGLVEFDDGSTYRRDASAHKALNYRNFTSLAQSRVWVPFHFLPGNQGLPAGDGEDLPRVDRLQVVPDSHVARAMLRGVIAAKHRPYALHRLGIAMHVYADTWSHQGFCGVRADVNDANDLRMGDGEPATSWVEHIASSLAAYALPLGHGAVLSLPDRPYARWSYVDGRGRLVTRDNPRDYLTAAHQMVRWMKRWLLADPDADVEDLRDDDEAVVRELIAVEAEAEDRLAVWRHALRGGRFSFGPAELPYAARGPASWKHGALGVDEVDGVVALLPDFARSDWKRFHDALQHHRFDVLHHVLPAFGILAD